MSGAEAALVLQLVSSALSCFEAAYQIYTAAHDANGLTKSFRITAEQIPLVLHTLHLVEQSVNADAAGEDTLKIIKPILERCKENAGALKAAFDKALPAKDASRTERYKKAAEMKWKSGEVKKSMELVMADLDLLAQHQIFQDAGALEDIKAAIEELAQVDGKEENARSIHYGSGNINNNTVVGAQENHAISGGSGSFYKADSMTFEISQRFSAETRSTIEQPWLIPRSSNPQYVGYTHILERLTSCLLWQGNPQSHSSKVVCVLSGMGGVGKSETILHFISKNDEALRKRYWAVLWVDCSSEASAQADFERTGNECGWSLAGGQALAGVKDQLASSKRSSLLILDNCDDVETDYNRYIPNGSKVSVILTTRLSDAKRYASTDPQDTKSKLFLQLNGLDAKSAVDLVLDASDITERTQQIVEQGKQMATALDFHPLAITVASSLIQSAVYSLGEYADALESRLAQKQLLHKQSEQARHQKVSATFEVSAESLQSLASRDPSAKAALALLDILAFLHHRGVSEDMLVRAWEYEELALSKYEGEDGGQAGNISHLTAWHVTRCRSIFSSLPPDRRTRLFREARAHLGRLSLVKVDRVENSMSLHLMVHAWARERVVRPGEAWTAVASTLALSAEGQTGWQPFTAQLVLHYETNFAIWNHLTRWITDQQELCRIWYVYAWQMHQAKSRQMLSVCLQLVEQTQGLCHDSLEQSAVAEANHLLGIAYRANGQITKAVKTLEHVVKVREKLAEDHPSRLASQHELAGAYHANGQITKAVKTLEHVVKMQEKLAEDHPSRLASQHELAHAYHANGQITKAVQLLKLVVVIKQRKFRVGHPSRTVSEGLLAFLTRKEEKSPQQRARVPAENESGLETKRTTWERLKMGFGLRRR